MPLFRLQSTIHLDVEAVMIRNRTHVDGEPGVAQLFHERVDFAGRAAGKRLISRISGAHARRRVDMKVNSHRACHYLGIIHGFALPISSQCTC